MFFLLINILIYIIYSDIITNLPNAPSVKYKQYSGYIQINETTNASLFYWFQESSNNPTNDPLILWTQGGPGCSGLAGALIEQGGYRIQKDGTLNINEYSWNTIANMIYIEQPIGVGFSFSNNKNDYYQNDNIAIQNMYKFIFGFLLQFPQFVDNDFYVASESYGGHYAPLLSKYIVDNNKNNELNFKGFIVGNPFTNPTENAIGTFDTFGGHSMIPYPLWKNWYTTCSDGSINNAVCESLEQEMNKAVGNIYPYGVDWSVCNEPSKLYNSKMRDWFLEKVIKLGLKRSIYSDYIIKKRKLQYDACAVDYMTDYLNRADVQQALHANPGTNWELCSEKTIYNMSDSNNPMQPIYDYLIKGGYGLKIAIYSGDDDSVCGTIGTQSWLWNMNYTVESNWRNWKIDGQNGGYMVKFKNALTFITVHSAGHQAPWFKPKKTLFLFNEYINGGWN